MSQHDGGRQQHVKYWWPVKLQRLIKDYYERVSSRMRWRHTLFTIILNNLLYLPPIMRQQGISLLIMKIASS